MLAPMISFVLHPKGRIAAACFAAAVPLASTGIAQCTPVTLGSWRVVNRPIFSSGMSFCDSGDNVAQATGFSTVTTGNGDILYTIPTSYGTRMGRFKASNKTWQLWTNGGWSGTSGGVGDFIDHTIMHSRNLDLFPHPTNADGVIGVGSFKLHTGGNDWDHHCFRANLEFDGSSFKQWTQDDDLEQFYARQVMASYSWTGLRFAYDPVERVGIAMGPYDLPWDGQSMGAVRYDHDETGAGRWKAWNRTSASDSGSWAANNLSWPNTTSRHAGVMEWSTATNVSLPRVTHLPSTKTYFVTYIRDTVLATCKYEDGPTPTWKWWGTVGGTPGWQPVDSSTTFAFTPITTREIVGEVAWNGKLVIFTRDQTSGEIYEIEYNNATSSFSTERAIFTGGDVKLPNNMQQSKWYGVDADGALYYAFTRTGYSVVVAKRTPSVDWTEGTVYTDTLWSVPVGVTFVNGGCIPLVFVERANSRIYALSPDVSYWSTEVARTPASVPSPVTLDVTKLNYDNRRVVNVSDQEFYSSFASPPGPMAIDEDGYIYSPRFEFCSLAVISPTSTGADKNYAWGNFWDWFEFPQGAAVDNYTRRVYVATSPTWGSEYPILPGDARVSIWEPELVEYGDELREQYVGTNTFTGPIPPGGIWNTTYVPDTITGLSFAADVAVDEARGLLYISSATECKVDVYILDHAFSPPGPPVYWYSFGSLGSGTGNFRMIKGIDVDSGGDFYAADCGNNRVSKWYLNLSTGKVEPGITWGTPGRGAGQFINPVGIAIDDVHSRCLVTDPVNNRVQVFTVEGTFQYQFSKYCDNNSAPCTGTLRSLDRPIGIEVDDLGRVHLGVGDYVERFVVP